MDRIANAPNMTVGAEVSHFNNNGMDEYQNEYQGLNTKELCVKILEEKLNCQLQFDEKDESRISFTYQGEYFHVDASKDCLMITIWDTFWGDVSLDDLDDICHIRKAINTVNTGQALTLIYSIDQENQRFSVHTKRQCLLVPQIPHVENYLIAMLAGFFDAQRYFRQEFDKLKREDEVKENK